jgi:hypothetical protein
MEEQHMFARIHDALDIQTPPGAYERLRTELTKKPVRPFRWPALQTRWTKMPFRFAAGLALIAIAVAAAAAAVAIHSSTNNVAPAGPRMSIQAYQKMVADDDAAAFAAMSHSTCEPAAYAACEADETLEIPALEKWISDVSRRDIPTRLAGINAQLRQDLVRGLAAHGDMLAASRAHDGPSIDRAAVIVSYTTGWVHVLIIPAIEASHQVDAATYVHLVGSEVRTLDGCGAACGFTATSSTCAHSDGITCQYYFGTVSESFVSFQADLIKESAPPSLAAKDAKLQNDFAQANTVLLAALPSVSVNDQAGFNSAIAQLERIKTQLDQDAANITG